MLCGSVRFDRWISVWVFVLSVGFSLFVLLIMKVMLLFFCCYLVRDFVSVMVVRFLLCLFSVIMW